MRAFTLVELLVTVSIIAVLTALIFSSGQKVMRQAQQAKCSARLSVLAKGVLLFAAEHDGQLPSGWCNWNPVVWQYDVAPYIGISVYTTRSIANSAFQCPEIKQVDLNNAGTGSVSYAINEYLLGSQTSSATPPRKVQSISQSSITILMGDNFTSNTDRLVAVRLTPFASVGTVAFRHYTPNASRPAKVKRAEGLTSYGDGRANIAFCDGHVESLLPEQVAHGSNNSLIWNP